MPDDIRIDDLVERAVTQVRDRQPDPALVEEAAARVWSRIADGGASAAAGAAAAVEEIRGCADYQALIPAYLAGGLPPARTTLLEDHSRECVPCRKALNEARAGEAPASSATRSRRRTASSGRLGRWALAATLLIGLGLAGYLGWQLMPFGGGTVATVAALDGSLFQVAEAGHLPIGVDTAVAEGQKIRTGRDGGAVLALDDGSRVELRARSEVAVEESRGGTTVRLLRGSVIVQAAEQRNRELRVATDDCQVAVTGTIFSVNHGTKGSRVSVIEGEVRVAFDGDETVLHPGDQITTRASLGPRPVGREIAWSRDADYYLSLLGELVALRREVLERVPRPELRYTSRLLDLMPDGTVFYAAVPNLTATLSESYQVATERLAESPALQSWWQEHGGENLEPQIEDIVDRLSELGGYIGAELAAGASRTSAEGSIDGPLVLAEVLNPAGLRTFLEEQVDELAGDEEVPLVFVDDPFAATPMADRLFLWLADDLLVASPELDAVQRVAAFVLQGAANPFVGSPFHQEIAALYEEGVGLIAAVDLGQVIDIAVDVEGADPQAGQAFAMAGLDNARFLIFEQKASGERTEHRAALTFRDTRKGLASWLAAPAPMGSLEFISPDAKVFAGFVVKDPAAMLDDINELTGDQDGFLRWLSAFEAEHGVDVRDDFAATLGGEVAFAIDGPLVPTPSWKLILEVYDPARLQYTLEQGIAEANAKLLELGQEPIEIAQKQAGGRTYYSLPGGLAEVHYTYVEGFLVAGPSRAMVDQAIRYRSSGYTITGSPRFTKLLPVDQRENFSALVYQDMASVLQAVVERLPEGLSDKQQEALEAIRAEAGPTLAYAYGEPKGLIVAATTEGDLLTGGLFSMLGWAMPFAELIPEQPEPVEPTNAEVSVDA